VRSIEDLKDSEDKLRQAAVTRSRAKAQAKEISSRANKNSAQGNETELTWKFGHLADAAIKVKAAGELRERLFDPQGFVQDIIVDGHKSYLYFGPYFRVQIARMRIPKLFKDNDKVSIRTRLEYKRDGTVHPINMSSDTMKMMRPVESWRCLSPVNWVENPEFDNWVVADKW
jgi:hypothetical protein